MITTTDISVPFDTRDKPENFYPDTRESTQYHYRPSPPRYVKAIDSVNPVFHPTQRTVSFTPCHQ